MTFVTGQHVAAVMADLATFIETRHEPAGPVESFATERSTDTVARSISTEDTASILLRFDGGARGAVNVSQISAGRKNSLQYEIDGSEAAWAWDSEQPDQAWIGHRDARTRSCIRNPALLGAAGRAAAALPGGHVEGFFDTFCAHFRAIYADVVAGAPRPNAELPDLRRRPRRDARRRRDRARARGSVAGWMSSRESASPTATRPQRRPGRAGGEHPMRLGLLDCPVPEHRSTDVVDWTAANGFESIEIACWPRTAGPTPALRRAPPTSTSPTCRAGQATRPRAPRSSARA